MKTELPSSRTPKRRSRGDSRSQLLDAASKILSVSDELLCAEQIAFAHLLRDDASVRERLQQFLASGDGLDQQS